MLDEFNWLNRVSGSLPTENRKISGFGEMLALMLNIILGAGIAVSIIAIILSGIKFITSKGDFKATAEAKSALAYSILAFILVIGAFTVKTIILNMVGTPTDDIIRNDVPDF